MFIRNSAKVFIYFSSSHARLLFKVGAFSIKCSKTLYFCKSAAALLLLDLKKARLFGVALIRLNAIGYCVFSKETLGAHFCPYFYFSFLPSECVLYVFLCAPASISLDTIQ